MAKKPFPSGPLHILVTAGSTREKIDEVRDWGNIFTGQTGLDLALAFLEMGAVTLLTSNEEHAAAYDGYYGKAGMLGVETFRRHGELEELLAERMTASGPEGRIHVVAMTAAVADYQPAGVYRIVQRKPEARSQKPGDVGGEREAWIVEDVSAEKVKSTHGEIAVRGVATKKLIDQFRGAWGFGGVLIKFKLEVGIGEDELVRVAGASRVASSADLMVANTLAMARPAEGSEGAAYLIDDGGAVRVGRRELAGKVVGWVRGRMGNR
jgi:phosphopantothenate---cysteine ligase (CTP)